MACVAFIIHPFVNSGIPKIKGLPTVGGIRAEFWRPQRWRAARWDGEGK